MLNKALKDEPNNKSMLKSLIESYEMKQEPEQAYEVLINNAHKFKWDIDWSEQIINKGYDLGMKALGTGDTATKDKYFKQATEAFTEVQKGIQHLAKLPEGQRKVVPSKTHPIWSSMQAKCTSWWINRNSRQMRLR